MKAMDAMKATKATKARAGPAARAPRARLHATLVVGIDPGMTGGLAAVGISPMQPPRLVSAIPMPCTGKASSAAADAQEVAGFVRRALRQGRAGVVVVEAAQSMPGQGVASSFRYGRLSGSVEAAARTALRPGDRFERVTPSVWKRAMGLGPDKREALELAAERLGTAARDAHWPRPGDHGVAEAALTALWWIERRLSP